MVPVVPDELAFHLWLLLLLGRLDECERWLREAVKLSPNVRDNHFELSRLLLKKGEPAQAAAEVVVGPCVRCPAGSRMLRRVPGLRNHH